CSRSARLTAVATTSMTTSSGPGSGSGTSVQTSASGPPGSGIMIARMVRFYLAEQRLGGSAPRTGYPASRTGVADYVRRDGCSGRGARALRPERAVAGRARLVADGAGLENR